MEADAEGGVQSGESLAGHISCLLGEVGSALATRMEFIRKFALLTVRRPPGRQLWLPPRPLLKCNVRLNSTAPSLPVSNIVLRDYQEECIQAVLKYLDEGHRRLGISLATGAGKTVIFTQLIDRIPPPNAKATKTLIIAHRRELVEQAARHCRLAYPDKTVEIEMGNDVARGYGDIIVASSLTLARGRFARFDPADFKLILVDEAHHIVARSYRETLEHFGLNEPSPDAPVLVGVSATFSRFDGLKLGAAIDHIVYHKDYVDMIGDKWLADAIFTTVKSGANLSRVKKDAFGDFAIQALSEAVNTDDSNNITVRAWMANAQARKSTLVFCVDVEHARRLTAKFRDNGIDARYLTATTPKQVRAEQLEAFKKQEYPVLLNCGLFTEGTDIPNIDCVLLARPTRSRNLLIQMIGRGLRLFPGKKNCHIIDMVASLSTGVLSTPTLFGLHPDEVLNKATPQEIREGKVEAEKEQEPLGIEDSQELSPDEDVELQFTKYDSVFDLLGDMQSERHIRSLSHYTWVRVDQNKYVLQEKSGWLTLGKEGDIFNVHHVTKFADPVTEKPTYTRPRLIATGPDLETAVRAADTYAASKFDEWYISVRQPWRQHPASSSQIKLLNQSRIRNRKLKFFELTKGKAADIITKLKFGGKKRFRAMEAKKREQQRMEDDVKKLSQLQKRTRVKVGPVEG